MPIFFLKRYHSMVPAEGRVWHLGREVALEAPDAGTAIALVKKRHLTDLESIGGLAILVDEDGRRIWDCDTESLTSWWES
jgi:hypothetical protein